MRVAIVQMTSRDDLGANIEAAQIGVADAVTRGAEFVALPESFAYLRREGLEFPCAQGLDGPIVSALRSFAKEHGIWLLGGTFPEAIPESSRVYNTSVLLDPRGDIAARYRKIHLFDVDLGASDGSFRESDTCAAGEEVVTASTPYGAVGLSVCYDLRFPELYRRMLDRDVRWITVPSAFAPSTGKDHWEVLLRARAIENQCFVIAPAQCGQHSENRSSHGRSLIVDPWGIVLAQAGDQPTVIVAECDPKELDRVRASIPCLVNRRI